MLKLARQAYQSFKRQQLLPSPLVKSSAGQAGNSTPSSGAAIPPRDILATTMVGEAGGEKYPRAAMSAVLSTICNRAAHPGWWGSDLISVATKPKQYSALNSGLASAYGNATNHPQYATALRLADAALAGKMKDTVRGANSYFNPAKANPDWAQGLTPTTNIGHHAFYTLPNPKPKRSR